MSVPLIGWSPPDGMEVLIAWLTPLGEVRDDRPTGAILPYRMVSRVPSPFDGLVDKGVYSVHTFAVTKEQAQIESVLTDRRINYLVGQFQGQQSVAIGGGVTVQADAVETVEYPHWVQWDELNTIHRYVATYRVDLRIMAA